MAPRRIHLHLNITGYNDNIPGMASKTATVRNGKGPEVLRAVLYQRVSSEEQEKGTSLTDQFAGNHEVAAKHAATVVAVYEDTDSGGFYLTRKGLQKALGDLESGKGNALIVKDFTRLSRNDRTEQAIILKRIREAGAVLIFWHGKQESSPMADFALHVEGDFSILEKAMIRDRTIRGRTRAAMEGRQPTRTRPPFGYILPTKKDILKGLYPPEEDGKYLLHPEQAQIAREIFEKYAAGASLWSLARWLQASGVKPQRADKWHTTTITKMIQNPVYYGKAAWGKNSWRVDETRQLKGMKLRHYSVPVAEEDWITMECPAIISKELFDKCQERRITNRDRLSARPTRRLILTGLMKCPACHLTMIGRSDSRTFRAHYKCRNGSPSSSTDRKGCWRKNLNSRKVEALVFQTIEAIAAEPRITETAYTAYNRLMNSEFSEGELNRLEGELKAIEAEETATVKAQIQGVKAGANTAIYEGILRELALNKTAIQGRIDEYNAALNSREKPQDRASLISSALEEIRMVLGADEEKISNMEKNQALAAVIESIVPDLTGTNFTITFMGLDANTRLVASVGYEAPLELNVVGALQPASRAESE